MLIACGSGVVFTGIPQDRGLSNSPLSLSVSLRLLVPSMPFSYLYHSFPYLSRQTFHEGDFFQLPLVAVILSPSCAPPAAVLRSRVAPHSAALRTARGVKTAAHVRGFYILERSGGCSLSGSLFFFFASCTFPQFCALDFFSNNTFYFVQNMRGSPLFPNSCQNLRTKL